MLTDSTSTTDTATEDSAQVAARLAGTTRIHVTRRDLLGAMRATLAHVCQDFTRPQLCGIAVSVVAGPMLQIIASDGQTIARVRIHCVVDNNVAMPEAHCLISSRDAECMIKDLVFKRKRDGDMVVTLAVRAHEARESGRAFGKGTIALDAGSGNGHSCDLSAFAFPDTSHVIPAAGKRRTDGVIGLNPWLMARLMDVPRMLGREDRSPNGVEVTIGQPLDPVRVSWSDPHIGEFLGVICPMRIS